MMDVDPADIERFTQALHAATGGVLPVNDDAETARLAADVCKTHGFTKEVAIAAFESRGPAIAAVWPTA